MKTLEQHIEEVMDWFDFNKVHQYMQSVNWVWASTNGVPEIAEMRQLVREYMERLYFTHKAGDNGNLETGTGGFVISYTWGKDENGLYDNFNISFVISSWYTGE